METKEINYCIHYLELKDGSIKKCHNRAFKDKDYCYKHLWKLEGKTGKQRYYPSVSNPQVILDIEK